MIPGNPSPKKERGSKETALELFVAGRRSNFIALEQLVNDVAKGSTVADDLIKVEEVRTQDAKAKVRIAAYDPNPASWEVVLHINPSAKGNSLLEAFAEYVATQGGEVELDRRIYA